MEKICRNCKYFSFRETTLEQELGCGNCQKPGTPISVINDELKGGVFKWDNDSCKAFEPKKNAKEI